MIRAVTAAVAGLAGLAGYVLLGGPRLPRETDAIIDRVSGSDLTHLVRGKTGYAESSGVRIWYESIPPAGAGRGVVLLSFAIGGDALFWPPSFLRALSASGYRVLRYDQRGTGASDWLEGWTRKRPYTLTDMATDAVAVLDAEGVDRAHMIGLSLGGFVAQELAIARPDRVASLVLMSSAADPTDSSLPGPRTRWLARSVVTGLPLLRYRLRGGERNLVKERIAKTISVNGREGLDVEELAELVVYDLRFRRGVNLRAPLQHQAAVAATRSRNELLTQLHVPTLVVHGTADAVVPIEHGRRLVELIPDALPLWLPGVGHQFPYPDMPTVVRAVIDHLDRSTAGERSDGIAGR